MPVFILPLVVENYLRMKGREERRYEEEGGPKPTCKGEGWVKLREHKEINQPEFKGWL